jgi:alkylated DNA repair dioxygenase AlkB
MRSHSPLASGTTPTRFPTNLLPRDGEAVLIEEAVPRNEADRLFDRLIAAIDWRSETAVIMGRRVALPRLTAWYGEASYRYSGILHQPAPWVPELLELKATAEAWANRRFNSVLANLYRDGRDSVGWHSDHEPSLGKHPVIASISLGAIRRFQLRHREHPDLRTTIELPHGSCLIMAGETQHHWQHQLPKTSREVGPRINLSYRAMQPDR